MKMTNSWLWTALLAWAICLAVHQDNAMAQQTQRKQPEKEIAIQSGMGKNTSQYQPSKAEAMAAAQVTGSVQPSKDEALAAMQGESTAAPFSQSASACSLCVTCGGEWPVFSGAIPTRAGAKPFERDNSCVGDLIPRADTLPYLCCKSGR